MVSINLAVVGRRLRELRGSRTQAEVAEVVGVTISAISAYERGEKMPRDSIKLALAELYGVSVSDIFFKQ